MTRNLGTKLLQAAAMGSTGVALTGGALVGVLVTEAKLARHWVGKPKGEPPVADGLYGSGRNRPISMVMLGDSMAAGLGVASAEETPAALIATGLSERANAPVRLTNVALVGAQSADLDRQVTLALLQRPDVALIMIGANDAMGFHSPEDAANHLGAAVRRLRAAGVQVVVGTCPDLGAVRSIAPPLRQLTGWHGRRLARSQALAVQEAGGVAVDLGAETGPVFRADSGTLCYDGFHPSADGYRVWAHALYPAVARAAAQAGRPSIQE